MLLTAILAIAVVGLGVAFWRLNREVRRLRAELKAVGQAEAIVARAQRRRHLVAVPALWAAREVKEHPVITAAAVGALGVAGLLALADDGPEREMHAATTTTTTMRSVTTTTSTTTRQTPSGVTLAAVPDASEPQQPEPTELDDHYLDDDHDPSRRGAS